MNNPNSERPLSTALGRVRSLDVVSSFKLKISVNWITKNHAMRMMCISSVTRTGDSKKKEIRVQPTGAKTMILKFLDQMLWGATKDSWELNQLNEVNVTNIWALQS